MWMNLDRLPAGTSQFTLYYACVPEADADPANHDLPVEEVDVQAPSGASRERIEADANVDDLYDTNWMTLIAIGDQSSGYFVYVREGFGGWVS